MIDIHAGVEKQIRELEPAEQTNTTKHINKTNMGKPPHKHQLTHILHNFTWTPETPKQKRKGKERIDHHPKTKKKRRKNQPLRTWTPPPHHAFSGLSFGGPVLPSDRVPAWTDVGRLVGRGRALGRQLHLRVRRGAALKDFVRWLWLKPKEPW